MRKIVIEQETYLWRTGYGDPLMHTRDRFTECFIAYLENYKKSPLRIYFGSGLCNADGEFEYNDNGQIEFDIDIENYCPKGAEKFIRFGFKAGWSPKTSNKPFEISYGMKVLKSTKS